MTELTAVQINAVRTVVESVLAGDPADDLQANLGRLQTVQERQAALCTACTIRQQVAATCRQRGDEIASFLAAHCDLFEPNREPCILQHVYGISLSDLAPRAA